MLSALALTIIVQHAPIASQVDEHDAVWSKYLSELCKRESVQIAFDCTPSLPPESGDEVLGGFGLDILAERSNRARVNIEGVQVFVRKQPASNRDLSSTTLQLLQTLAAIEDQSLIQLCKDGLDIGGLSVDQMRSLLLALPLAPVDCIRVAKGERLRVALDLSADYVFVNSDTGKIHRGSLYGDRFAKWMFDVRHQPVDSVLKDLPISLVEAVQAPPQDGLLDFGGGTVMTLGSAVARAAKSFGCRYFFDSRLRESKYFFSGRFTQQRFEQTVRALTKMIPLTDALPPESAPEYLDIVRKLKNALAKSTTPYNREGQLALLQRQVPSTQLAGASRAFASILSQVGLGSTEFNVELRPVLGLSVFMPPSNGHEMVGFRLILTELGN